MKNFIKLVDKLYCNNYNILEFRNEIVFKEMTMAKAVKPVWILCPRCELNYIKKADQYCNVCLKEMKLIEASEDDIGDLELCPMCKINFVQNDQEICDSCRQELGMNMSEEDQDKEISDWHKYIDDDDDEDDDDEDDYNDDNEDTSGVTDDFDFVDDLDKGLIDDDDIGEDLDLEIIDDDDLEEPIFSLLKIAR